MANIINTSFISDPNIQQPWTGPELKFLQDSNQYDNVNLIMGMNPAIYNSGFPVALWGCQATLVSGTTWNIASGAISFISNGTGVPEIFSTLGTLVSGPITLTGPQVLVGYITTIPGAPDPITFSDGIPRNVCDIRMISFSAGTYGSTILNHSNLAYLNPPAAAASVWSAITYNGTFADYGVGNGPGRFRKDDSVVRLDGNFYNITGTTNGQIAFNIPVGYRPAKVKNFAIPLIAAMGTTSGNYNIQINGDVYINYTGTAPSLLSLDGITYRID